MRVFFSTLALLAYAGLISADATCQQQSVGPDTTPGLLAIYTPALNDQSVIAGQPFKITWDVRLISCSPLPPTIR